MLKWLAAMQVATRAISGRRRSEVPAVLAGEQSNPWFATHCAAVVWAPRLPSLLSKSSDVFWLRAKRVCVRGSVMQFQDGGYMVLSRRVWRLWMMGIRRQKS